MPSANGWEVMAKTERLRDLAEEIEGLAHRNFSDPGEEIRLLVARNDDFHSIKASGNSRLQHVAERAAGLPLGFGASYCFEVPSLRDGLPSITRPNTHAGVIK